MKRTYGHPSASRLVQSEAWDEASKALASALEQHQKGNRPLENPVHAAHLLCDATLAGSPYETVDFKEVLRWWNQCLADFSQGVHLIDPTLSADKLNLMRSELRAIEKAYDLIVEASQKSIDELLLMADAALEKEGGHFLIPIIYKSQNSGKEEAFLVEFTREKSKLYLRMLNRGEGMRLHPVLAIRDGKRLHSYCTEKMLLRDQAFFLKLVKTGIFSKELEPSELGQTWIRQLKGYQLKSTTPEEIYAVLADVIAEVQPADFKPYMASTPARSATSFHHLPRILFRHHQMAAPKLLKRLNFAVKAQALFQVFQHAQAGSLKDFALLRDQLTEIHSANEKLARNKTLNDQDLARIHVLTEALEKVLPVPEPGKMVSTNCQGAQSAWQFIAPAPRKLHEGRWNGNPGKPKAKVIRKSAELSPGPENLLARLNALAEDFHDNAIAEMHALLSLLPLPSVKGPDLYWNAIAPDDRLRLLTALRRLLQRYGSAIVESQETELPRAILSVATAYCIADSLARCLEGDPLKLKGFGLKLLDHDQQFFFHRREQIERWRALQDYFLQRNEGLEKVIFSYYRGKHPWGILSLSHNKGYYYKPEQHLLYLKQFALDQDRSLSTLIARRYLYEKDVYEGLKMPEAYDDLHYFAVTLNRLWQVSTQGAQEDLGVILRCDQIPVLLRYNNSKKKKEYYELIYCNADSLPTDLEALIEHKRTPPQAPTQIQPRQTQAYSKEAEAVFFSEDLKTENQIMHAKTSLGNLPQLVVHALQLIMLQRVYRLKLSQLMDFCFRFPTACRHPDVRVLIENVLLEEGSLYTELRQEGGKGLLQQIYGFLRAQRDRTAASESGFDDHLLWQRLTLDVEQLAPKGESQVAEMLAELDRSTKALKLDERQRAALALHRAYLYRFYSEKPVELLRYWIEARTLRRKMNKKSLHWMEGEVLRHIELQSETLKAVVPEALEQLATFIPGCTAWTEKAAIYEAQRGIDFIVVDPFDGCIFCNDLPLGSPPEREPQSLSENVCTLLNVKQSPPLKQGADKIWRLESDQRLRFESRAQFAQREIKVVGRFGAERYEQFTFYQIEDLWEIPAHIRSMGKSFWCTMRGFYAYQGEGSLMMIEEDNGDSLIIYASKDFWDKKRMFAKYIKYTVNDGANFVDVKRDCNIAEHKLAEIRTELMAAYRRQLTYLAIRDFSLKGDEKNTRWQLALELSGIPRELLVGHSAWIECDSEKPRLLMLDTQQKPSILLSPTEEGYQISNQKTGTERVVLATDPWIRLAQSNNIIAWAKDGQLEAIIYPYLEGLCFQRKGNQFECLQFPGFFVQTEEASELPGYPSQLLLKNSLDQCRLLIPEANRCVVYEKNKSGAKWQVGNHAAVFKLLLLMISCAQPLAALSILDQIGDEEPLSLEDWKKLATLADRTKRFHGAHALILQLALRITELQDATLRVAEEADKSLPFRITFWKAVDIHLAEYGQDRSVPVCLQLREEQLQRLRAFSRPQKKPEPRVLGGPVRTQFNELYHAVRYTGNYTGTERPAICAYWTCAELGGNLSKLALEAVKQKQFPAPIDLHLRATLERKRLGLWDGRDHDDMRLDLLVRIRARRDKLTEAVVGELDKVLGNDTFYAKGYSRPKTNVLKYSTVTLPLPQIAPLQLIEDYEQRPFAAQFKQLVTSTPHPLPEEAKDLESIVSENGDELCETVQKPIREMLKKPVETQVDCYALADNAESEIKNALSDLRKQQEIAKGLVEEIANRCKTLAQQSLLLSPQHPPITVFDVLVLFNPKYPRSLLERNPFLDEKDLKELMKASITFMECGWKMSQLEEALTELEDKNAEACAAILGKKQTFNPFGHWWLSLYQFMSGNLLRSDPDQAAILLKVFACLENGQTDPAGSLLKQLYFEFPAGGGKTKVITAIVALLCLSMGKTPIFFSFPNLVDICHRDFKQALAQYFQKRCEYLNLTLSTELNHSDLSILLERLERQDSRPSALVMVPEGYQLLDLEYRKALSAKDTQRVYRLDKLLCFYEDRAVFLIDEGHRNKDSLLNANIAIGEPKPIPSVYRALQHEVYRYLANNETLGLQQNGQASLSTSMRKEIIRNLLRHMLSMKALNVDPSQREDLMAQYLMDKTTSPPEWLLQRYQSKNKKEQLQAQWIAQLRGLATEVLPFTLSLKGMIDHGPSIHSSNEVEAPRDHGQLSGSKFEVPDIALGLTHQGFLQRGLQTDLQFITVLKELKQQAEIQSGGSELGKTPIEMQFLEWQGKQAIPLREIDVNKPDSGAFQEAFRSLRSHREIILRYVAAVPAGQVAVYNHRLLATAAGLSYGAAQAVVFSATLGMRSQYTYYGDDASYCEDTAFLAKVIRKACLHKNARVELDHSSTPLEFIEAHQFGKAAGFLDFGGACGARRSSEWSQLFLDKNPAVDGTLYAQQQVDAQGKIGEKVLYLHLRGQNPRRLEGSDLKSLLRKPELHGKQLLRILAPEDNVGMDVYAGPDAEFIITIGENCCLDDLAQALLRARRILVDVAQGHESQTIRWIVHDKIAHQIRDALDLSQDIEITPQFILRWALLNMVKRLREAIQARAYQEIEAVYMRLLRAELRGKPVEEQLKIFKACEEAVYKKMGYNPFEQWGYACVQKGTREVLSAFNEGLKVAFGSLLHKMPQGEQGQGEVKVLPAWAEQRVEQVIGETENLIAQLPSHRSNDFNARQVQKQEVRTQARQRMQKREQQRVATHEEKGRIEARWVEKELCIKNLTLPLNHSYIRSVTDLFKCEMLPKNLYLTQDTLLTQAGSNDENLWRFGSAKPYEFLLVLRAADQEPVYLGLSQEQATQYLIQLQKGEKSELLDIGMLDIQGHWLFPMQSPPSKEEHLPLCQATCLLDGRLDHPDHLLKLAEQDAQALERLWNQVHSLHLDAVPAWETVLAYTTDQNDLLDATANSIDTLEIGLPKGPPVVKF